MLPSLALSGHKIDEPLNDVDFIQYVKDYCEGLLGDPMGTGVCILLDVWNTDLVYKMIQIMSAANLVKRPTIILISSLLTWAGKNYSSAIRDSSVEFPLRRPSNSAQEAWMLENMLWSVATKFNFRAYIVGSGLLYGGPGYDVEPVVNALWSKYSASAGSKAGPGIPSLSKGRNTVPMIHVDDLSYLVNAIVKESEKLFSSLITTPASNGDHLDYVVSKKNSFGPVFLHATDGCVKPLAEMFPFLSYKESSEIADDILLNTDRHILMWSANLAFSAPLLSSSQFL